jgi:hypothetical protein
LRFSLPEYDKSVEIFVNKLNKPQTGKQQYYLTSSNSVITEGQSFVINLTTQNVENGTLVPYTITGISGGLLNNQTLTGTFNVLNNQSKLNINTNQRTIKNNEIFKLTLDNKLSSVSVLIKPVIGTAGGIGGTTGGPISGIVIGVYVKNPGLGYTSGDTIGIGSTSTIPTITPNGSIISVPIPNDFKQVFTSPPDITINTKTGFGAKLIPVMKFVSPLTTTTQFTNQIKIINVKDCP